MRTEKKEDFTPLDVIQLRQQEGDYTSQDDSTMHGQ